MMDLSNWITLLSMILLSLAPSPDSVKAAPIEFNFSPCTPAIFQQNAKPNQPPLIVNCCPVKPKRPIIEGMPPLSTDVMRVRKAAQCTDKSYAEKLKKGYELMRALPDDDPRSLTQQAKIHCAYCGGAFSMAAGNHTGLDIHWSWLFFPWHRLYMYFHERILQSLLGDPTFSLSYWNWDNPFTLGDGESHDGHCQKAGSDFPVMYDDVSASTYDSRRSRSAKGHGRFRNPDLNFVFPLTEVQQPLYNATEEDFVTSNINVMYQAMVSGGTTTEIFFGSPYRAGDLRGSAAPLGGGGTLERGPHSTVHLWSGEEASKNFIDMGSLAFAARDPVFHAHHSNVDRLWDAWKSLGPLLDQKREDYSDPDWLKASFLFYDENKDLRRVSVTDALDTTKLGYVYQKTNDASWIHPNQTKCSNLNYTQLIARVKSLPVPIPDSRGVYHLEARKKFTIVIRRPSNPHGKQEFLTIKGIKLDRMFNAGFNVFVNLLYPEALSMPSKCAEYNGRFANMATSSFVADKAKRFTWRESITRTFVDIRAKSPPSKVVITLMPFGHAQTITFESITIST